MRILAAEPAILKAILKRNLNDAESGAKMVDLEAQVSTVSEQNVAYVTILIGANDLCTRTVAGMTSVDVFGSRFEQAMGTLAAGSPRARIYVPVRTIAVLTLVRLDTVTSSRSDRNRPMPVSMVP